MASLHRLVMWISSRPRFAFWPSSAPFRRLRPIPVGMQGDVVLLLLVIRCQLRRLRNGLLAGVPRRSNALDPIEMLAELGNAFWRDRAASVHRIMRADQVGKQQRSPFVAVEREG